MEKEKRRLEVESVLVTGANQGIGLEIVRQLVRLPIKPHYVFASYRNKNSLRDLIQIRDSTKESIVILIKMDATKKGTVKRARKKIEEVVGNKGLTLLINTVSVVKDKIIPAVDEEDLLFHFTTNTMGPVMVLQKMFPLLKKSATFKKAGLNISRAAVINISSMQGSISELDDSKEEDFRFTLSYRTSKAALNMAMRVTALWLQEEGILTANMCPDSVISDEKQSEIILNVPESVTAMIETWTKLDESHHGAFLDRNGKAIPF